MASILNANTGVPPGALSSRPSRIPVRTGYSSGSDSDESSKSESKSRTGGKSRLPVPVRSQVKNSSKPAQTSGSQSDPENNSVKGVEEKVVPATGNADIANKDDDTAAEPIKKMPTRLKSLKIKKISSVNQARCDPLSRSVIPGIKKKQVPATPSSDALAFTQQGRLRPASKFQSKKTPGPSSGIARRTSYRNMHGPDEQKKVSTVGLKDPKNTSASSSESDERPSRSSLTGTKNTTTSKARKGAKSDRKDKKSDVSESDNSLGLKPRKISLNYEAESDDPVSTVSEASCSPMEAKSKNDDEIGRLTNTLGYDEAYDVVSTDSEASCSPMEAKNYETNNNEPFMADIQWLRDRNIEYEDLSDFSSTDSYSEKPPQKDQIQVEKLAQPSVPDIHTEDHKDDQAPEKENEDILSDSFWDINPNKHEQSKDQPEAGPREEPMKNDKTSVLVEAEIEGYTPKHQQIAADEIMTAPVPNQCVDGMISASNETNNTTGKQSGSQNHEPSTEGGSNRKEVSGGSGRAQGSSVGGSGDGDDPNDPKKLKPSKEPDDKNDEDDKKAKERAANEAIAKEMMGNTDEGCLQEVEATQTEEEGNVTALYKAIRSKENEIDMMKKLLANCRHDYEELQGNFDKYTNDFKEVDANRAKISILTHENKFLQKENSLLKSELCQSKAEAIQAKEERKEVKIMLSKIEVDFDFLVTEKKELLTKLKLYEANTPPEQVNTQEADHKQEAKKSRVKHQPGKSSSLQDIDAMRAQEEGELKNMPQHCEKASKDSEEIKELKKTLTALQEKLLEDVTQIKQMKSKIESSEAERERLEKDLRKTEEKLAETIAYKDREISNLMKDNDKKEQKNEELTHQIKDVLKGNDSLRNELQTWCQKYDRKDDMEKELKKSIDALEIENENLLKELSEQRLKLLDARREKIEDEDIPRTRLESLQNTLKTKIEAMTDVINNVEEITANNPVNGALALSSDLECVLQLLYDIYELLKTKEKAFLKAVGCRCSCSGEKPGPSSEEEDTVQRKEEMAGKEHGTLEEGHQKTPERDLQLKEQERFIDDLKERINVLTNENHKLEKKVKEGKGKSSEDTQGGESDEVRQLQKELKEKELHMAEIVEEIFRVRAENDMLADYVKDADIDIKALTSQNEMQSNHIKRLQNDCANQRIIAKSLQEELSECTQKNATLNIMLKDVEEEGQKLQEKLEAVEDSESSRRQTEIHLNHIQKLQEDCQKQRLISKNLKDELAELKKKNATLDAVKSNETVEHLKAIQRLQEDFEHQRLTAQKLRDELSELKDRNESLDKKLKEVEMEKGIMEEKLETVKDAESFRRQTDIHLNHIQKLQKDGENQRLCVKKLKSQVFELESNNTTLDSKLKDVEAEKYALEQKLNALSKEIQKDAAMEEASTAREGTPSTSGEREEQIQELQEVNEKLSDKIEMLEAFFEQVKEDKAQSMKALDASRKDVMMLKKKSDEKIAELEKHLADKNGLEIKLQNTVTSLEKRISVLEAEKADKESELKAVVESLQRHHELENYKQEWKELELELRKSITALTTEKSEAQKELEEQKLVATKASESLAIRMEELDTCQQERQDLKKELECLKSTNTKLKEEMAKKLIKAGQDADQRLAETKHSSLEIINELEKQLKDSRNSEIELKERTTTLKEQVGKLEAEKLQSDQKIRALMESIEVKEIKAKQGYQDQLDELNEHLKRLSERESQARLAKQSADNEIMALERQLLSKGQSEEDQRERMASLEEKITRLETERSQHCKSITSIIRNLKTKEDLVDAIAARDEAQQEYNIKIDEMENIANKLRMENRKEECNEELKERYKMEYEESRRNVRKSTEKLNRCNEKVKELQAIIAGADEDLHSQDTQKTTLHENIERLKEKLKASDTMDLLKTLQSLKEKITKLEAEKADGKKMITALLKSIEVKESSQMQQKNTTEVMKNFRDEKKLFEDELQDSQKMRAAKESESELLETQTDEKISALQQSEREIRKRLETMSGKLVQLESSKDETNKTIQTMLESLQRKDNLEQCLDEKEHFEKDLKRMQEFKLEKEDACRDMHKMKEQISELKEQLLQMEYSKEKAIKSLKRLEKLLEKKDHHLRLVKRTMKDEVLKLKLEKKDLEIEKKQSQMETRNAFELIKKQSDDFDESLNKRNESSERMMAEIENLKQSLWTLTAERDELDYKAKKYAKLAKECKGKSREVLLSVRSSFSRNFLR